MPFNVAASSSASAGSNSLSAEQLQLMNHLAQQQQQQRLVYPPLEAALSHGQLIAAGYVHQPPPPALSMSNTSVRPQPQLRGSS